MTYIVPNVSEAKADGTKVVALYNEKSGITQQITVPAAKADEFVSQMSKISTGGSGYIIGVTALGALAGLFSKTEKPLMALCGAGLGGILSWFGVGSIKASKANKLTQNFIKENSK